MMLTNLPLIPPPPLVTLPGGQSQRLLFIPPTQIERETSQVRQEGAIYDGAEFEALVNSIRLLGIQQPLTVEEIASGDSTTLSVYRLIAGHRRHEVALRLGLAQVPCLVVGLVTSLPTEDANLAQIGRRVVSQLAENMVRAEMDVLDKAIGLKTAKVLADIGKVQEYLASLPLVELGIGELPAAPTPGAGLANAERLAVYEQHLAALSAVFTSQKVAQHVANPQIVYPVKGKPGEYALADQALAAWQTIEQACGVSKSQRATLIRLLQLEPALIRLIRGNLASNGNNQNSDMLRTYLEAALTLPEACREGLIKTYLAYLASSESTNESEQATGEVTFSSNSSSNSSSNRLKPKLEAKVIRLVAECLLRDEIRNEWQSVQGRVDYWRLIELATQLSPQHFKAEVLASLYLSPYSASEVLTSLATGQHRFKHAETGLEVETEREVRQATSQNYPPNLPLEPDLSNAPQNAVSSQNGNGKSIGKKTNPFSAGEDEADEGDGFGGGGGDFGYADIDETGGFEVTGLASSELPPELLAELESLNLSDAAVKAITSLGDITLQRELVARVKEFPHIAGKLRRIVALVRDEGWSLAEALDEALGWVDGKPVASQASSSTGSDSVDPEYNPDAVQGQLISGLQRLLDAASSLEEGLELLSKASPTGKLADLPEAWAANCLQILDQLRFTLSTFADSGEDAEAEA